MATTLKTIFEKINTFDDIKNLVTSTDDGESPTLEFKSLPADSFSSDRVGETKAVLAKEICAFLNTNDGLIAWGADFDKSKRKASINNKTSENLMEFLDRIKLVIVEPVPAGIDFKIIQDDDGNSCLLIYVPRSDFAPHRVGSWDADEGIKSKNKKTGRYFQRIGTSSQVMPENLVRSMYLSRGRVPSISVHTELSKIEPGRIDLTTVVKPDERQYVGQYYNSNQIVILNDRLQMLTDEDHNAWREIHRLAGPSQNNPIYPKSSNYELLSSSILGDEDEQDIMSANGMNILGSPVIPHVDGDIHLTPRSFTQIYAIATKSNFSCESVPLIEKKRLYILGPQRRWTLNHYDLKQDKAFRKLEEEFGYEIFVARPYQGKVHDDIDVPELSNDGELRTSGIKNLLEELEEYSHD